MSDQIYLCGVDSDHEGRSPDWVCEECVRIGTLVDAAEQRGYENARKQVFNILILVKKRYTTSHTKEIAALEEINSQVHFMEKKQ